MENKLEKILQFKGQNIKVITDKGIKMFNIKKEIVLWD